MSTEIRITVPQLVLLMVTNSECDYCLLRQLSWTWTTKNSSKQPLEKIGLFVKGMPLYYSPWSFLQSKTYCLWLKTRCYKHNNGLAFFSADRSGWGLKCLRSFWWIPAHNLAKYLDIVSVTFRPNRLNLIRLCSARKIAVEYFEKW